MSLRRFAIWRAAIAAVAAVALGALALWASAAVEAASPEGTAAPLIAAFVLALATLVLAASLMRGVEPGILTCRDGRASFVPTRAAAPDAALADLAVAIDLGSFLLLTLSTRSGRRRWLPVQRRGLERDWHALRCAVHAPLPALAGAATAEAPS